MRAVAALVWKDLAIEWRTRELVTSMALVAFLSIVILGLATGQSAAVTAVAAAILWVTVAFAATLGLARAYALEQEHQALQGVLLTPVSRSLLFVAKCASNLILVLVLEAVVVFAAAVFVSPEVGRRAAWLAPPLVLGGLGFTAAGTLLGAMTATTRLREVLLPILLLPVTLPVIIVSLSAIGLALQGAPPAALGGPLGMLAAFDTIFIALGLVLFESVVQE
jgi:heme exporter protein B